MKVGSAKLTVGTTRTSLPQGVWPGRAAAQRTADTLQVTGAVSHSPEPESNMKTISSDVLR